MDVDVHRRIKETLKKLHEEYPSFQGFYIVRIAKKADTDTRTTVGHLKILEENGLGRFLDPDFKVFTFEVRK